MDTVTYPDARVIQAVEERFVPLTLDLFKGPRDLLRTLSVIWTPTILFADRRGAVHYRTENFLPPDLFITALDIGEANVDMRWSRTDHAIDLMRNAYEREPEGILAPEVLYWWGVGLYLKSQSHEQVYEIWDILRYRFPDSIWAAYVP